MFDLSLGYNTMDGPANEYLRNIGVQLVVQNVTDRRSAYGYRIATGGGNPCTCDTEQHSGTHHLAHRHQGMVIR